MLACLPPLPLVLLSASLNCFNLAQSAVGYDQWHSLSSILFVLASLKIQKHICWLEKKYFAKIFDRVLSEEWAGLQRWSFHNNSHSELVSVCGSFVFLNCWNILNNFSGFQVLELTPRSLVGQNSSLQVLRWLLWQQWQQWQWWQQLRAVHKLRYHFWGATRNSPYVIIQSYCYHLAWLLLLM